MGYCGECGTPLKDGAMFCIECGLPVKISNENVALVQQSNKIDGIYTVIFYVDTILEGQIVFEEITEKEKTEVMENLDTKSQMMYYEKQYQSDRATWEITFFDRSFHTNSENVKSFKF